MKDGISHPSARPSRPLIVASIGAGAAVLLLLRLLVPADWNPSVFIRVGEESPAILAYAREQLGEVVVTEALGHDGRFFFVQANDPFHVHPEQHAHLLDRPRYRAQRMLYPTLAGGFGLLSPWATTWGLAVVNVGAYFFGTLVTARLAQGRGLTPWLGLAFVLNLALAMELFVGGAGILALALAVGGVAAAERKQVGVASAFMTAAALTREAMLVAAAGLAFAWWRQTRRVPWRLVLVPACAAAAWFAYLIWRIPPNGVNQIEEIGLPFRGLLIALDIWKTSLGVDGVVAAVLVAVCVLFAIRAVRSGDYLAWSAVGFVAFLPLFSEQVWMRYFDITRGVSPVLTAYPVLLFARRHGLRGTAGEADGKIKASADGSG